MMNDAIEHYAKLAIMPGWIDYVRHRVKELEHDETGMWIGLSKVIAQKIKELNVSSDIQS